MRNGRTISIPTLCFNYADNKLESIETCGEMYIRVHAVERVHAENAKLRELVRDIWDAYRCEEVAPNVAKHWHDRMRELGVDDG